MYIVNDEIPDEDSILVENFLRKQKGVRYYCRVDGETSFRGVLLPVGTREEIGAWFAERNWQVLGLLSLGHCDSRSLMLTHLIFTKILWSGVNVVPQVERLLVEIEGIERMVVLHPCSETLLEGTPLKEDVERP